MVDWTLVWKIFFITILGTFFSSAILTLMIKFTGIFFTKYFPTDKNIED
jgi:hypothetical protein